MVRVVLLDQVEGIGPDQLAQLGVVDDRLVHRRRQELTVLVIRQAGGRGGHAWAFMGTDLHIGPPDKLIPRQGRGRYLNYL